MPARPDARAWGRRNIQPSAPVNAGYYNIQPDQPFTGPADRLDDRSANGLLSGDGGCDGEEERKIIRLVCPREGDACARKQADDRVRNAFCQSRAKQRFVPWCTLSVVAANSI